MSMHVSMLGAYACFDERGGHVHRWGVCQMLQDYRKHASVWIINRNLLDCASEFLTAIWRFEKRTFTSSSRDSKMTKS